MVGREPLPPRRKMCLGSWDLAREGSPTTCMDGKENEKCAHGAKVFAGA